jgi:hypothetical protein
VVLWQDTDANIRQQQPGPDQGEVAGGVRENGQ